MTSSQEIPLRVLLVDDDQDVALLILSLLNSVQDMGFDVVCAASVEEGIEKLSQESLDVVLLDYYLGNETGLHFLEKAQALEAEVPIIFLTSNNAKDFDIEALQRGAMDYLHKESLAAEGLTRAIRHAIERKNMRLLIEKERNKHISINREFGEFLDILAEDILPHIQRIKKEMTQMKTNPKNPDLVTSSLKAISDSVSTIEDTFASLSALDVKQN